MSHNYHNALPLFISKKAYKVNLMGDNKKRETYLNEMFFFFFYKCIQYENEYNVYKKTSFFEHVVSMRFIIKKNRHTI